MIRHDHKVMDQEVVVVSIMKEHINQEPAHPVRLEKVLFLKGRSGYEVNSVSRVSAKRGGHKAPQGLKPIISTSTLSQRWKRCATQKRRFLILSSRSGSGPCEVKRDVSSPSPNFAPFSSLFSASDNAHTKACYAGTFLVLCFTNRTIPF
jgi:hypothetical protein